MNLSIVKQNPVLSFIAITLGLSFAVMLLPIPQESAFTTVALLAATLPTIVAFSLVAVIEGRQGVSAFLRQSFQWRIHLKWYVIAFAAGFVIHFGSTLLAWVTGRIPALEYSAPNAFFIAFFPLALLEEIGWRGFALRRLLRTRSPLISTVLVAVPWALIHIILFVLFAPETSAIGEGLVVIAFAFFLGWIFVRGGHNVLVATVMHGAINAFGFLAASIPDDEMLWYVLASSCILIAVLLLTDWRTWLGRRTTRTVGDALPNAA